MALAVGLNRNTWHKFELCVLEMETIKFIKVISSKQKTGKMKFVVTLHRSTNFEFFYIFGSCPHDYYIETILLSYLLIMFDENFLLAFHSRRMHY